MKVEGYFTMTEQSSTEMEEKKKELVENEGSYKWKCYESEQRKTMFLKTLTRRQDREWGIGWGTQNKLLL